MNTKQAYTFPTLGTDVFTHCGEFVQYWNNHGYNEHSRLCYWTGRQPDAQDLPMDVCAWFDTLEQGTEPNTIRVTCGDSTIDFCGVEAIALVPGDSKSRGLILFCVERDGTDGYRTRTYCLDIEASGDSTGESS